MQEDGIEPDIIVPQLSDPLAADASRPRLREADLQRHLINEVKADDKLIEADDKPDPRFADTPETLKKKGVTDYQMNYAVKLIERLAPGGGGAGADRARSSGRRFGFAVDGTAGRGRARRNVTGPPLLRQLYDRLLVLAGAARRRMVAGAGQLRRRRAVHHPARAAPAADVDRPAGAVAALRRHRAGRVGGGGGRRLLHRFGAVRTPSPSRC